MPSEIYIKFLDDNTILAFDENQDPVTSNPLEKGIWYIKGNELMINFKRNSQLGFKNVIFNDFTLENNKIGIKVVGFTIFNRFNQNNLIDNEEHFLIYYKFIPIMGYIPKRHNQLHIKLNILH